MITLGRAFLIVVNSHSSQMNRLVYGGLLQAVLVMCGVKISSVRSRRLVCAGLNTLLYYLSYTHIFVSIGNDPLNDPLRSGFN